MKRTIIILALSLGLISGLISIIIQAAAAQQCLYTINGTSASFPAAGGAGTINVFTSSECRWTAVSSADWIEITSGGSGFGNGTVGYSVAENTGAARIGTITVAGIAFTVSSAAALSQTPDPVRRLPGLQSLTFYERTGGTAPNPFTFAADGPELAQRLPSPLGPANSDFRGTTREFYDVFYSDQDGTFNPDGRYVSIECVFDQQDGALNIAEVSLNFVGGRVENFNRLASFLALGSTAAPATAANAVDGDLQTHTTLGDTLGQSGRLRLTLSFIPSTPCTYTISPTRADFYEYADTGSISLTATSGCEWTAVSNASWITITSAASGRGGGQIDYAVEANTGDFRTGTLTVAGQTFTVTQESPCRITFEPQVEPFLNTGGQGRIEVQRFFTVRCAWSATSNAEWLTITSGATGFGFGVVSYTVAPNPGPRRTGTITVNGKTHTVIQSPACEYAVYHYQSLGAPLRASSPPILIDRVNAFELFEVRAPADCSWLATSAFEWISFSRNDESREMAVRLLEGRGNATIKAYFTDNNDALSRREGVLDIAGRSARVIQPHNGEQFYECLYLLFLATQPGERQIGYAFRDRVLAGTPRGREYTKLYYDHSPEAVRVAMLNPLLILRSREIFERYRPVIESMISGQGAVLTRGDLDEIEAFMTTFAERGSSRMRDVIRGLARDLRDPRMHEEFGLTVIDGPRRELPASGFLGIRLSSGLIPSIGLLSACLFIISLGRRKGARSLLCVALTLLVGGGQPGPSLSTARGRSEGLASGKPSQPRLDEVYGRLPLSFEANEGQADPRVKFISRGKGYSLMLARNEATLRLPDSRSELRMKLVGADERSSIQGVDRLPSGTNYFIGEDETRWRSGVTSYARVRQSGLYPGVDMIYYGNKGNLEYDFILAPGADPHAIRIAFEGIERIDIDESGDLVLLTAGGEVRQRRPFVYQEARDRREEIPGRYVMRGREVGFEVGDYDRSRPLVIDPVLTYSTYLGGGGTDQGLGLVTDQSGNIYLTGFTSSINFPTSDAAQSISGGDEDAFIVKLSPSGDRVVYATYLGGGDRDNASQIAVDSAGNAYVTGATDSTDFPLRNGLQQASPGGPSAFVSKLSPSGSLVYSTYLGGSDTDFSTGVAVDSSGNLYVAGATASDDFPLVNAIQRSASRTLDNYVAKLSPAGDRLIYSTYLGGGGDDFVTGIAVDSSGNAYITGVTTSLDFPVRHAMQPVHGGGLLDAFLAKLSPSGDRLVYSTYLGGSGNDRALRIAADAAGNAYVTGDTDSANFPVLGGIRPEYGGSADAFAAKLNSSGSRLVYSTYLGGSGIDGATAVAVGAGGALFVTGFTNSTDFPLVDPAQQTIGGGGFDSFAAMLNGSGSALIYSTYLGGAGLDSGFAIASDSEGSAYVMGVTASNDFPTVGPLQQSNGGGTSDLFISKLSRATPSGPVITGASASGKKLFVSGSGFDDRAKILLNGQPQKTKNDAQSPATVLIGKKAGKRIARGETVTLQVRNRDGALSNLFSFTRP